MRWGLVIAALLTSGCNQLLGLEETLPAGPIEADRDADAIADERDNCPDHANHDQLDADDDGAGDACDGCDACVPCTVGPDHDEDGDLIPDGCDNCPTVNSANIANADNDDLGDVCDTDAGMQHRVFFDGFGGLAAHWSMVGPWVVAGDAAEAIDGPHPLGYKLTHLGGLIGDSAPWTLDVAFDVPVSPAELDSLGANIVDEQGTVKWGCRVIWQDSTWNLANGIPSAIVLPSGPTTMRLSSLRGMSTDHLCKVPGNPEKSNLSFGETYPMSVELFSSRTTRFSYVEVIQ